MTGQSGSGGGVGRVAGTGRGSGFDAVVVGAGPAGSLVSHRLASLGVRTLVVDRSRFPRGKLCGGCLAQAGQRTLEAAGLASCMADAPEIDRLRLRTGKRSLNLAIPAYRVVDRSSFDLRMIEAAVGAGAEFRDGVGAQARPDGTLELDGRGSTETLRPRVVIIADGLGGSSLRGYPGFSWRVSARSHVGIGGLLDSMPPGVGRDAVAMFHGRHGYLGLAPIAGGGADVAAAVSPAWVAANAGRPPLAAMLASFGLDPARCGLVGRPMGSPRLTRHRTRLEDSSRVFVCGDAAGYLEPFTGEGMSWALGAAERLGPLVIGALEGAYEPGAWTASVRREWSRRRVLCRSVSALLRRPGLTGMLTATASAWGPAASALSLAVRALQAPGRDVRGSRELRPGGGVVA